MIVCFEQRCLLYLEISEGTKEPVTIPDSPMLIHKTITIEKEPTTYLAVRTI